MSSDGEVRVLRGPTQPVEWLEKLDLRLAVPSALLSQALNAFGPRGNTRITFQEFCADGSH